MKLRNALVSAVVVSVGLCALAPSAGAATSATFLISGALAITVPTSANLGTVAQGATSLSGQLGDVTVTDTRGAPAAWTTTVSSTTFTTGAAGTNQVVALGNITYTSGNATSSSGAGAFVPLDNGPMNGIPAARTVNWTGGDGNNTATWNPTLSFALLTTQLSGTYAGTITHSVA